MKRTHYCGLLREENVSQTVTVCGWVLNKRDMGGVIFIDLRDREGTLQIVCNANNLSGEDFKTAETLKNQSVIAASGILRIRDEETYNPKLPTGTIELSVSKLEQLSSCAKLPFPMEEGTPVREDLRMKYRFLDLRRPEMVNNLRYRHKIVRIIRDYLDNDGFVEVETPMLTKSTPEGARDYLVPSRVHPGKFYALPQSPQLFKQLLMVGGIDKYYQIARCFRDEDLRADRQPEFTQVDMELSFIDQEDILVHLEKMFKYIFREATGTEIDYTFPRITWTEAMDKYGSDKPDLRFDLHITDLTEIMRSCGFTVFRRTVDNGGVIRAINVKGGAAFTRSDIESLTESAIKLGAGGMAWIAIRENGEIYSILEKYFTKDEMKSILDTMNAEAGDFILFCADKLSTVRRVLGGLRLILADKLELRKPDDYKFLIVTDFPQFEYSEEEKRYVSTHHPFTMPYPEDVQYLISDPSRVRAQAYDVVLNGTELGSGSIRIHNSDVQTKMFEALGFGDDEIEEKFGFMVNAFRYGTPPHGGFAFGLDRLVMLLVGAESLRDVIAFPKNKDAACPLTNAPDNVDIEQLEVLHLTNAFELNEAAGNSPVSKPKFEIDTLTELAKLSLSPDEKKKIASDMEAIIGFAGQLMETDTAGIKATEHITGLTNCFRDDVPSKEFERDKLLSNAQTKTDEFISVPKVVG